MATNNFGIISKKSEDFFKWYTEIVTKSELLDYYDVKGCFIMRPRSMHIWGVIRKYFDEKIKYMGVDECYFPMIVTQANLEKEKEHLSNFDPELAWITRCGETVLDNPVAIRPTSEAIIYGAYAKWLKTYRDLPLKLNQWCSVLRWEVKSTLPFIRGREFLWQEGHTAHYKKKEAEEEILEILNIYENIYKDLLAVPVIKGLKSFKETFGGAEYTLSIEAYIPGSGKGIQAATTHFLGQKFSKIFDVKVENDISGVEKHFVYQNSWGLTTRSIGIATMIHSDNKGFVCPPKVAQIQIVAMLCGISKNNSLEEIDKLKGYMNEVVGKLKQDFRVHVDDRDNVTSGFKFNHWELRGIPLRLEIGFRDMAENSIFLIRRDTGKKMSIPKDGCVESIKKLFEQIHQDMYLKAKSELDSKTKISTNWEDFMNQINEKYIVMAPWCKNTNCENHIAEKTTLRQNGEVVTTGVKTLCIPFEAPKCITEKCINCDNQGVAYTLFGRSY